MQHLAKAQPSTQNEAGVFHAIRGIGQLQAALNQQRNDLSAMHNTLNARIEQLLEQQQQMNGTIVDVGFSVASHLQELQRLMNDTFVDIRLSVRSDLLELERQMNITVVYVDLSMAGMNRTIDGVRSSMDSELLEQRKRMNGAIADVHLSVASNLLELERQMNGTMIDVGISGQSADLRNLAERVTNHIHTFDKEVRALRLQLLDAAVRTRTHWPPTNIKTSITRRPPTATVKTSASQKRGRIIQADSHSSSSSRTGTVFLRVWTYIFFIHGSSSRFLCAV